MNVLRRAVLAYYRGNVAAWVALRRWLALPMTDLWVAAGLAQFAAVVALVARGHTDVAWSVAAAGVGILVLQRLDR